MDTTYRKNLKAVAQACKDYTDKTKEEIYWHIGDYSISTQSDNTTASTKTVPTGATRVKIKKIYGLTEKFNPSVAYDNASTMTKTMPNIVYDFDCSIVYGNSEVSENLAVFDDVAETTINGVKVKYQDGAVYLDGTANAQIKVAVQFKQPIYANRDYYVKLFTSGTTTATNPKAIGETNSDARLLIPSTTTFNVDYDINYFWFSVGNGTVWTNYVVKPMIVKGTTEPTEWKQGFSDIHNIELTGIKSEGANKAQTPSWIGGYHTTTGGYWGSYLNGIRNTTKMYLQPSTQYTISYKMNLGNSTLTRNLVFVCQYTNDGTFIERTSATIVQANVNGLNVVNFTSSANVGYVEFSNYIESVSGDYTALFDGAITEFMVNIGSTALPYEAYVSTTKTIELSTILYNGNPLFEGNSLKAVNDVKDSITPYKATKKLGYVDLGSLDYTYVTDGDYPIFVSSALSDIKVISSGIPNFLSNSKYTLISTRSGTAFKNSDFNGQYTIRAAQKDIMFQDTNYTSESAFKTAMSGVYLVYELATPIEVSIDWSSTLRGITGYSNGTITLVNTNNQDTDNTITYNSIIKENCCAKIVQSRGGNVVKTINLTNDDVEYGYSSTNENNVRDYTTNVGTINVGKRAYQSGDESDTDVITDMEYTYYPLTTPTTESLTAIDNIIEVEPSDVLSFYNSDDELVTVPSDITYRIEVERV